MATTSYTVTRDWQSIIAGPQGNLSLNSTVAVGFRYFIAASTPDAAEEGIPVNPASERVTTLASGQNLYVKATDPTEIKVNA